MLLCFNITLSLVEASPPIVKCIFKCTSAFYLCCCMCHEYMITIIFCCTYFCVCFVLLCVFFLSFYLLHVLTCPTYILTFVVVILHTTCINDLYKFFGCLCYFVVLCVCVYCDFLAVSCSQHFLPISLLVLLYFIICTIVIYFVIYCV